MWPNLSKPVPVTLARQARLRFARWPLRPVARTLVAGRGHRNGLACILLYCLPLKTDADLVGRINFYSNICSL